MEGEPEQFISGHARSVLVTRRADGGLQASPVRVLLDSDGNVTATTRAATAKARNLARDPRYALCVIDDNWTGPWMTIEGTAEIVRLPEALPLLLAFYEHRDGPLASVAVWENTMVREGRVLLVFSVERSTPPPSARRTTR